MIPRQTALAAAIALGCAATLALATTLLAKAGAASTGLPDWSGQWENVGATPDATGGFNQTLDQVLKQMEWSPPLNAATKAKVDAMQARERKRLAAVARGEDPGGAFTACTFGYPGLMLDTPLMFEVLVTPKETALIFSSREIRHIYTDGRPHTAKKDLWATPWGDSIGHWEGQTLVMDTIAVKDPYGPPDSGSAVAAFGDVEGFLTIGILTQQAHFIERMRMIDPGHLEDQMTIIDPANLTAPWHMRRTYERVAHLHRMVYEDCEGEDRNPVVDGHFTLTPPPSDTPSPAPAASAPTAPKK
ncbi:MAG TPA: hypothetical protein VMD77_13675 [Candidatus Baltobacteraceae bacterium]|jgi:hypothetical protein|nr:hypothetical protein [Candidatus Baltobacteraceae bacterium]